MCACLLYRGQSQKYNNLFAFTAMGVSGTERFIRWYTFYTHFFQKIEFAVVLHANSHACSIPVYNVLHSSLKALVVMLSITTSLQNILYIILPIIYSLKCTAPRRAQQPSNTSSRVSTATCYCTRSYDLPPVAGLLVSQHWCIIVATAHRSNPGLSNEVQRCKYHIRYVLAHSDNFL